MTSTAPGAHPPPEEVDALLDLSGGDARVSAHVEACERCGQVRDDLREVRALLGAQARTLPPEPPDLGARIAAALAAEPPLRRSDGRAPLPGAVPSPAAPARGSPGWDRSEGGQVLALPRRRRWPAYLAVAASVAVVGLGGTFLAGTLGGGGSDAGTAAEVSSADAGRTPAVAPRRRASPSRRAASRTRAPRGARTRCGPPAPTTPRDDLAAQASRAARRRRRRARHRAGRTGRPGVRRQRAGATASPPLGRDGVEPAATDVATYEGQPAVVLVLPSGRGYDVLVVPVGCGSGDDRVLAGTRLG